MYHTNSWYLVLFLFKCLNNISFFCFWSLEWEILQLNKLFKTWILNKVFFVVVHSNIICSVYIIDRQNINYMHSKDYLKVFIFIFRISENIRNNSVCSEGVSRNGPTAEDFDCCVWACVEAAVSLPAVSCFISWSTTIYHVWIPTVVPLCVVQICVKIIEKK